jgi:hypothetical protein
MTHNPLLRSTRRRFLTDAATLAGMGLVAGVEVIVTLPACAETL